MKKILGIMAALLIAHTAAFAVEIEAALAETAEQFSKTIKTGSTIAIIGISSGTEEMSDFMLDELTVNFVKLRKLKVADRANLAAIKKEMNFQLSGEVGDDSIQQIGAMAGAQTVIRGTLKPFGESYLLVIHALNVTTAAVEDIYRAKIDANGTAVLLLSGGTGSGNTKVLRADRYHGGELAKIGFGNLLFGTGAYIAGETGDGIAHTVWEIANLGMIIGGTVAIGIGESEAHAASQRAEEAHRRSNRNEQQYNEQQYSNAEGAVIAGVTLLSLGLISGVTRIIYGFVRPKYYTKKVQNKSMGAADILNGLNFAIVPHKNGNTAVTLAYALSL